MPSDSMCMLKESQYQPSPKQAHRKCLGDGSGRNRLWVGFLLRRESTPMGVKRPAAEFANELRKVHNVLIGLLIRHRHRQERPALREEARWKAVAGFSRRVALCFAQQHGHRVLQDWSTKKCVHGLSVMMVDSRITVRTARRCFPVTRPFDLAFDHELALQRDRGG
jgi:hypothetical protein